MAKPQQSSFLVRKALMEDAAPMGFVHTDSWKTTYKGIVHQSFLDGIDLSQRIDSAIQRINNPISDTFVLVEKTESKVVGFAQVGPCRERNVDADGELYAIYLLESYQGRGGGKMLFDACVLKALERGFQKMMVSVLERNAPSRAFYEKNGGNYIGADHVNIEDHRYPTSTYLWVLK